MAHVDEVV